MTVFGDTIALYDCRKPLVIARDASIKEVLGTGEELNDLDVTTVGDRTQITTCDDSGLAYVYSLESDQSFKLMHTLSKKHSNICFKSRFDEDHYLYTAAFDYKLVQWNL